MFEVADLAEASPATVSRCGMVYLEPSILGIDPFVTCWLNTLPPMMMPFRDQFQKLFDDYLEVFKRSNIMFFYKIFDDLLN